MQPIQRAQDIPCTLVIFLEIIHNMYEKCWKWLFFPSLGYNSEVKVNGFRELQRWKAGPLLHLYERCAEVGVGKKATHIPVLEFPSCRTSGRLVTMPEPRGRKSLKWNGKRLMSDSFLPSNFSWLCYLQKCSGESVAKNFCQRKEATKFKAMEKLPFPPKDNKGTFTCALMHFSNAC